MDTAVGEAEPGVGVEAALAARAVSGEPGAFGQLYQRHVDGVYSYCLFQVHDPALAEDLTHDVFVSALRHVAELQAPERFRAWLIAIAHRRVLNHWRDSAVRPLPAEVLGAADDADEAGPLVAVADADLENVAARLDAAAVLAAATGLTDLQRQVIALRFVAGLSLGETAEAMDRSVNAVKNLQHHALTALRRRLGPAVGMP